VIGGLVTPSAVAVICAVPTCPGVQTCGLVSESQVPAQAVPFPAMVTTAGLLDWNEKVSLRVEVAVAPLAIAVKINVWPTSNETFEETADDVVSETLVGTVFGTTLVDLLLLQEIQRKQLRRAHASDMRETTLPIKPSK
jgi:hypothetical protein